VLANLNKVSSSSGGRRILLAASLSAFAEIKSLWQRNTFSSLRQHPE